jgi:hypothetical protein
MMSDVYCPLSALSVGALLWRAPTGRKSSVLWRLGVWEEEWRVLVVARERASSLTLIHLHCMSVSPPTAQPTVTSFLDIPPRGGVVLWVVEGGGRPMHGNGSQHYSSAGEPPQQARAVVTESHILPQVNIRPAWGER